MHFCDYPAADASRIDTALEERMAVVRSVVGLGRKLREDQKLKVRQPLATLTVVSRDARVTSAARTTAALIADELNVKQVEFSADEAAFCTLTIKPNFQALRERAGSKLKPIGEALKTLGHARDRQARAWRSARRGGRVDFARRRALDAHSGEGLGRRLVGRRHRRARSRRSPPSSPTKGSPASSPACSSRRARTPGSR